MHERPCGRSQTGQEAYLAAVEWGCGVGLWGAVGAGRGPPGVPRTGTGSRECATTPASIVVSSILFVCIALATPQRIHFKTPLNEICA